MSAVDWLVENLGGGHAAQYARASGRGAGGVARLRFGVGGRRDNCLGDDGGGVTVLIASAITRSTVKGSEQALGAMAGASARLISARPETLLMQMQGYAVVAAAEGNDQTGELVRAGWIRRWETVHLSLGADVHATTGFIACGMLGNTLTAIGLPSDCREAGA